MRSMKKLVLGGAAAIGLLLLAWFGILAEQHFKRQADIKAKLEEAIGRDAGYTETILRVEKDSSHITYGEVFELCNKSVDERTSLIVELRGLYPSISNATKDKLIDFLNAENDAVRAKRDLYRSEMRLSTVMDDAAATVRARPSSEYGWDFYRERLAKSKEDMVEAATELQNSGKGFLDSYQKTLKLEAGVAEAATHSGIRFKPTFREYDQSNEEKGRGELEVASQMLKQTT